MIQHYTQNTYGKGNKKEYIVLHNTATGYNTIKGVINTFKRSRGSLSVSAHYVIDTNGDVYKFNTDNDQLRHCGFSKREGKEDLNHYAIGIEIIGPLPGFTESQKIACRNLIYDLMKKYKIPSNKIIRHKDITKRKTDVDDAFRNNEYKTFKDYQNSFNNNQSNLMDKVKQIQHDYKQNDGLYDLSVDLADNIQDETLKDLYSQRANILKKINARIREMKIDPK